MTLPLKVSQCKVAKAFSSNAAWFPLRNGNAFTAKTLTHLPSGLCFPFLSFFSFVLLPFLFACHDPKLIELVFDAILIFARKPHWLWICPHFVCISNQQKIYWRCLRYNKLMEQFSKTKLENDFDESILDIFAIGEDPSGWAFGPSTSVSCGGGSEQVSREFREEYDRGYQQALEKALVDLCTYFDIFAHAMYSVLFFLRSFLESCVQLKIQRLNTDQNFGRPRRWWTRSLIMRIWLCQWWGCRRARLAVARDARRAFWGFSLVLFGWNGLVQRILQRLWARRAGTACDGDGGGEWLGSRRKKFGGHVCANFLLLAGLKFNPSHAEWFQLEWVLDIATVRWLFLDKHNCKNFLSQLLTRTNIRYL